MTNNNGTNKVTLKGIAIIVSLVVLVASIGIAWGTTAARLAAVEEKADKIEKISESITKIEKDIEFIKGRVE